MDTDELILHLAAYPRVAPPVGRTLARLVLAAILTVLALVTMGWGIRPDLMRSLADPVTALKPGLPGLVALVAIKGALGLAQPGAHIKGPAVALLLLALAALGLLLWSFAQTPPEAWIAAVKGRSLATCLLSILTLAVLPTLALLVALRQGASLAPSLSGGLAGLGGGAAAASLFALYCTEDNPLFFLTWYSLAVLACAGAGAALGRSFLRW